MNKLIEKSEKIKKVNTWTEDRKKQYFVDYFKEKKECNISCECGSNIRLYSRYHHMKTQKHLSAMYLIEHPDSVIF